MGFLVVFGPKQDIAVLPQLPAPVPNPAGRVFPKCAGGVAGDVLTRLSHRP